MAELGLSIYPSQASFAENAAYLKLAAKYGYTRVFTSLLEITDDADTVVAEFKQLITVGNELGMKTILDINPSLFAQLGVTYNDLHFFADLGAWGLRLDEGFTGAEEAKMTQNPYGLKIEVNISRGTHYIDQIADYAPNRDNLLGSHNFYPQRYTGLGQAYFAETSQQYRNQHIRTAAFVNAPSGTFGPWPVADGLVSLETHRDLPIATQVQEHRLSGLIDDVLIGNAFASEEDLKAAATAFNLVRPQLRVVTQPDLSAADLAVLFKQPQMYRGDRSDYVLRSTMTRVIYKNEAFPPKHTDDVKYADVLIDNEDYGQYKGELQIALQALPNDGRINVVGHIHPEDLALLVLLQPWGQFDLIPANE
ncbi:DUF871 domain-containing protein [Periweissella cryptocerci]|uniref:DUF871 domain-containing protein n=1 Tax=Periweissella cryptocerci TaxID=2506420 RepID=A0A4P6YTG1_9LACO|nr:MupG family TIM beta-alpha barrel fold protein [Periweissella cryptocerci]QBO36034.1 DUF871 domain-containing protein [Periweissella cryptocerci]